MRVSVRSQIDKSEIYSHLSATNGSTFVARRAGIKHAATAITNRPSETIKNVGESVGAIPNNNVFRNLVNANAPPTPSASTPDKRRHARERRGGVNLLARDQRAFAAEHIAHHAAEGRGHDTHRDHD